MTASYRTEAPEVSGTCSRGTVGCCPGVTSRHPDESDATPVARLTITITYLAPLKGQKTSKVRVETVGEVAGAKNTEHRNHWTVWGDEEAKLGSALAGGVYEEIEEPLRDWAASAEVRQCRIWRAELSQRLLSEIASSPEGPRESELRRILAELDGAVVPRAKPTPACRQLLAGLSLEKVENAAWAVIRHAERTGDIREEAKLVEQILDAVLEDMKGAAR